MSTIARRKIISNRIAELCAQAFTQIGILSEYEIQDFQRVVDTTTGIPKVGRDSESQPQLLFSSTLVASIEDNNLIRKIDDDILGNISNDMLREKFFIRNDYLGIGIDASGNGIIVGEGGEITYAEEYLYNVWFTAETAQSPPQGSIGLYSVEDITTGGNNPFNISQFVDFTQVQTEINLTAAKKVLDLDITELIPAYVTQQQKIDQFFADYIALKGAEPGWEDLDSDDIFEELKEEDYLKDYEARISSGNDLGYITRLEKDANEINANKTLEWLRNDLNNYLKDIDKIVTPEFVDERPEYENKSEGYIKLRALNQGIIIRKQEGLDVGMSDYVSATACSGPSFQCDGFTITMWVKFLDRVNTGTLFNYGNPVRPIDPTGFQLQTYVLFADDMMVSQGMSWRDYASSIGQENIFIDDYARFIRLVIRDHNGQIRDSHIGQDFNDSTNHYRVNSTSWDSLNYPNIGNDNEHMLLNYTQVPIDFEEWFYIVASYDPTVDEDYATADTDSVYDDDILPKVPLWWLGHFEAPEIADTMPAVYTSSSGYGAKCKVEFIRKSKLLRARGYKPE